MIEDQLSEHPILCAPGDIACYDTFATDILRILHINARETDGAAL